MNSQDAERVAEEVVSRVLEKLGQQSPETAQIVAQEVAQVLASTPASPVQPTGNGAAERIVVTANGPNRAGIVARLSSAVDEFGGDIRDISQTIVSGYFTMILVVDISGATRGGSRFGDLRLRLKQVSEDLGIHIVALHDDILATMHTI